MRAASIKRLAWIALAFVCVLGSCVTWWPSHSDWRDRRDRQGFALLDALHRFKNAHGVWPMTIRELLTEFPYLYDYIDGPVEQQDPCVGRADMWFYIWYKGMGFALDSTPPKHKMVKYRRLRGRLFHTHEFDSYTPPCAISGNAVSQRAFATMGARLRARPNDVALYHGRIYLLMRWGRISEARGECLRAVEACPEHWWPRLALARVEAQLGHPGEAKHALSIWALRSKKFEDRAALVAFLLEDGSPAELRAATTAALEVRSPDERGPTNGLMDFSPLILARDIEAIRDELRNSDRAEAGPARRRLAEYAAFYEYE